MANALAPPGAPGGRRPKPISWLPLYPDMGLVGFLLMPLSAQMSIDHMPRGDSCAVRCSGST
jgi:fatty-acyl-CoA synthase